MFSPGHKKSRGRPAGSKNRVSVTSIRCSLAAKGFDIAEHLLGLLASTQDDSVKLKVLELLAKYTQLPPTAEAASAEAGDSNPALDASVDELAEAAN